MALRAVDQQIELLGNERRLGIAPCGVAVAFVHALAHPLESLRQRDDAGRGEQEDRGLDQIIGPVAAIAGKIEAEKQSGTGRDRCRKRSGEDGGGENRGREQLEGCIVGKPGLKRIAQQPGGGDESQRAGETRRERALQHRHRPRGLRPRYKKGAAILKVRLPPVAIHSDFRARAKRSLRGRSVLILKGHAASLRPCARRDHAGNYG